MNSKLRREFCLYLDRNIGGRIVPEVLRQSGLSFERHDDHLSPDAPDEDWIRLCSDRDWLAVTKDKNLRHNGPACEALKKSRAAIIVVTATGITGQELGELLVKQYDKILKFCTGNKKPFVAHLSLAGKLWKMKF